MSKTKQPCPGPQEPIRSEVAAQMLGVTRAAVYQYWQRKRLRAWKGLGDAPRTSWFYEKREVEALAKRLQELRRIQDELGYSKTRGRKPRETPTEWEECVPEETS